MHKEEKEASGMIVLSKEEIAALAEPDEMMDVIEEAYRIFGAGHILCRQDRWWNMRTRL